VLNDLSEPARAAILARSVEKRFATGQLLWSAGDDPTALYIVLEGKVRIVRGNSGRQTVIHSGNPGSTLGEVPFFTNAPYPATAVAAEPTRCLLIDYAALEKALRVDPSVAFYLLRRLSLRVEDLVDKIAQLSAHSVKARLAAYLLERSTRSPQSDRPFSLGMTQAALAEELGTVREVIVRALRALRDSGAIEPAGAARYKVIDAAILTDAAREQLNEPRSP
jgi:CRP/FNR family cyclic AMP-dependent transcriptional regulator